MQLFTEPACRRGGTAPVITKHPVLLDEHVEDIANTRFPDRELDRLLHEILRIHALKPGLDAGTLKFHLTENGFGTVVNRVLSPQVLTHAASARPLADPEIVRQAWSELARQVEQIGEARDVAAAEQDLATDMSVETWARHQPLFERKQRG